ncbi:hypothetical protein DPMN_156199 [Dreissena polymorpha]|uniref:Uncharacterized protein n=1 Tax=Dreissena polymorpha TaxID=45954 RepID=A0A9D4J7C3_DREPO|nr:hypothetical protein DPMN_156199 [Dreissena polymorpha]
MGSGFLQSQQRGSSGIERWGLRPYRVNTGGLVVSRDGVCGPTESPQGSSGIERWGSVVLQSQQKGSSGIERWGLPSYRVNRMGLAISRDEVCRLAESTEGVKRYREMGSVVIHSQQRGSSGIERWWSAVLQSQQKGSSGIDRRGMPSYRVNTGGLAVSRDRGLRPT